MVGWSTVSWVKNTVGKDRNNALRIWRNSEYRLLVTEGREGASQRGFKYCSRKLGLARIYKNVLKISVVVYEVPVPTKVFICIIVCSATTTYG
jgi:hypothetical protein